MESLIFFMPFFNGLYFPRQYLLFGLLFIGYITYKYLEKDKIYIKNTFIFKILLSFNILYLTSIIYAVDKGIAIYGFLKMLVATLFFIALNQMNLDKEKIKKSMIYSAVALTVIGIMWIFIDKAAVIDRERFFSFVGYVNVYGIYMLINLILINDLKLKEKLKNVLEVILLIGIILTFSRAIYLLTLVIFITKKEKLKLIFKIGMAVIFSLLILNASGIKKETSNRISEGTSSSEFQARLLYYEDAINIIKDHPLGVGYNGYIHIQKKYQTGVYGTRYVHNSFLQYALEIGIPGLMLFIIFLVGYFKDFKFNNENIAFLTIIIHSIIDVDLSFLFIFNIMILLFYFKKNKKIKRQISYKYMILPFIIIIYFLSVEYHMKKGNYEDVPKIYPYHTEAMLKSEQDYFEEIYNLNKYHLKNLKIKLNEYLKEENYEKAEEISEKITEINRINIDNYEILSSIYLKTKKYDKLYDIIDKIKDIKVSDRAFNLKRKPKLDKLELIKDNVKKAMEDKNE